MVKTSIDVRSIDEGRARVDELIKSADASIPADGYELTLVGYYEALQVTEELAAADPANAEWQRYLAVIYERIGNVWWANSDPTEALAAYYEAHLIRHELVKIDPADTQLQHALIAILEKISDMHAARGEYVEAVHVSMNALDLREALPHEDDPAGTSQQHAYFATLNLAAAYLEEHHPDRAPKLYRAIIDMRGLLDPVKWRETPMPLAASSPASTAPPAVSNVVSTPRSAAAA
jgi:tetratricopeptide (TPR) repeat protein